MSFHRPGYHIMEKWLELEPRRFMQLIYGPRQGGKTTVVRLLLDQTDMLHHYVSALK